ALLTTAPPPSSALFPSTTLFRSQRGYAEGLAAGKAEAAARAAKLAALGDALARPLENVERAVEEELLGLSIALACHLVRREIDQDRKSTRLNSSHVKISYAVFCL